MRTKSFRSNVLIDNDKFPKNDLEFIRNHGLKPTNLLRSKIKELRAIEEGEPDATMLIRQRDNFKKHRDELLEFINQNGLTNKLLGLEDV